MHKILSILSIVLLYVVVMYGQAAVDIPITVTDNGGGTKILRFGLDLTATNGIDPLLGESDLPPFPPVGVYETRFDLAPYAGSALSTYWDYRNAPAFPFSGTRDHKLQWQFTELATTLSIAYNLPASVTMRLVDPAGGSFFNSGVLSGAGTYSFTPPSFLAYGTLTITYVNAGGAVAPSAPFITSAIADTHFCTLQWNDLSNNETGFKIQRKLGDTLSGNPWLTVDSVGANVTTVINTGLLGNTTYSYRMFAYNAVGNSANSNQVQITTIVPVELTSFTGAQNGNQVLLAWTTATELNNKGFEIERKLQNTSWEKIGFIDGKGTTSEIQNYSFSDNFKNKVINGTISYRLRQIDFDGRFTYTDPIEVIVNFTPKGYTLLQNHPNPFNPSTVISYTLPFTSSVKVEVFNMLGQSVGVVINQVQGAGYYDLPWNAGSLSSGVYFYSIEANSTDGTSSFQSIKKMMLMK